MTDYTPILELLECPACHADVHQAQSTLVCTGTEPHRYPIIRGVARFTDDAQGGEYNRHWRAFADNPHSDTKLAQAKAFVDWLLGEADASHGVAVDLGAGNGNHIRFFPPGYTVIAIDRSYAVELLQADYGDRANVCVLQADAAHLPLKSGVTDIAMAYGSLNYMAEPAAGVKEAARILRAGGTAAFWGYGTHSRVMRTLFNLARGLYRALHFSWLRGVYLRALLPAFALVTNSTQMKLGRNDKRELLEIVSTNVAPETLHILGRVTWRDFAGPDLEYVDDYAIFCGQRFEKRSPEAHSHGSD